MNEDVNPLALDQQVCFPIYAVSRLITRLYQPLLDELGITYTQYLVMLVLWEHPSISVGEIGEKLYLNTNTLTPLLSKLQDKGLLKKVRSQEDERKVFIKLTDDGVFMREKALCIPIELAKNAAIPVVEIQTLKSLMWNVLDKVKDFK